MGRQTGINKIEGTLSDLTFYKMKGNFFVRTKRNVSRARILTDPKFARVRENGSEFGIAVRTGKLLRDCVKDMFRDAGNHATSIRVLQLMLKILKLDLTSDRGKRNAGIALANPDAKKLLKGFEFNSRSQLHSILLKPYLTDTSTGIITIPD